MVFYYKKPITILEVILLRLESGIEHFISKMIFILSILKQIVNFSTFVNQQKLFYENWH